jgi:hypothetical protein
VKLFLSAPLARPCGRTGAEIKSTLETDRGATSEGGQTLIATMVGTIMSVYDRDGIES